MGEIRVELRKLWASLPANRERTITTHEGGQFVHRSFETLANDTAAASSASKPPGFAAACVSASFPKTATGGWFTISQ